MVIDRIEKRDGRKFVPLRKQMQALGLSNRRWGKLAAGDPSMTLEEANKVAYLLCVDVECLIGKREEVTHA